MFWQRSLRVLIIPLLLISVTAETQKMHRIATGVWGGEHIRIEVGTKSATVKVNGQSLELNLANGYARVKRLWHKGDVLELNLPMLV